MAGISWSEDFAVGVDYLDREHQHIFGLIDRIDDAAATGLTGGQVNMLIAELVVITRRHFEVEERYMLEISCPDYERHAGVHRRMLERLDEHAARIQSAGGKIHDEFLLFLHKWLTAHIGVSDAKYAEHASRQEIRKAG